MINVGLLCCLNCMLIVIFLSVQVHSSLHFILHEVVGCLFPCVSIFQIIIIYNIAIHILSSIILKESDSFFTFYLFYILTERNNYIQQPHLKGTIISNLYNT